MSYLKKAWNYIKAGDLKSLFRKIITVLDNNFYFTRVWIEDRILGGISINKTKPSKYSECGAYATQSTNYCWLDKIFGDFPLPKDSVFVDVGCGEGRVLTYLYMRGFRGKMIGIELDPDVAETARLRTQKCSNIQIYNRNVLDAREIIQEATAFYLFNPFNEEILKDFIQLIEESCNHPVYLYYSNDLYRRVLDKRNHWFILRRNAVKGPTSGDRRYTLYFYHPDKE